MLPKNPIATSLDKITAGASLHLKRSQPLGQLPYLLQEGLLPKGVELKKHPLAASGGNGGEKQLLPLPQKRQRQAEPVSPGKTVALLDPHGAADASGRIVAAVLKAGGDAAAEDALVEPVQRRVKVSMEAVLVFRHKKHLPYGIVPQKPCKAFWLSWYLGA